MDCPTCRAGISAGPYRAAGQERQVTMRRVVHATGVAYDECPGCGGVFLDKAALMTIERAARAKATDGSLAALAFKRSYQGGVREGEAKPTRYCPRCREELFERPWSTSAMIRIDVCAECEGVWLDAGELEAFDGRDSL